MKYPIFTIEDGMVVPGAEVNYFRLRSGDVIPAITVGEEGRGRELGVVPVQLPPELHREWLLVKTTTVVAAGLGETRTGRPKLVAAPAASTAEAVIVVLKTPIGFRGGNEHTGDYLGWKCRDCDGHGTGEIPAACPHCGGMVRSIFGEFPGQILVRGVIADGTAGRMGAGDQIIALVPRGKVFRTGFTGRRYGRPKEYWYVWDGARILVATAQERELLGLPTETPDLLGT